MKLHIVAPRTGLLWVRQGVKTFFRQPLALAGQFFMFMLGLAMLSMLPYLGMLLSLVLLPAATVGLMVATREADQGRFPMPVLLLSAFRQGPAQTRAMLVLGACYAVGLMLVLGLSALFDGGTFASIYLGTREPTAELMQQPGFGPAMLIGMGLYLPLAMVFWHAPALVHWHGVSPIKSLFFSAATCWRNRGAMAVYLLGWMAVFMGLSLGMSLIATLIGGVGMAANLLFPLVLLTASMFFSSIYFSFRDSFEGEASPPPQS